MLGNVQNSRIYAFGERTSVPNDNVAKLMYYLSCVDIVINYNEIDRLTDYQNYDLLTKDDMVELFKLVLLFNPKIFIDAGIFIIDESLLPYDLDNQFYKITDERIGIYVNDEIMIGGKIISREEKEYILLNKPRGVVTTTSDDKNRKTVIDLIDTEKRLYPVGRLDYDTTGALLLTNDGELTNLLIHPRNKVDKVYIAKVRGFFDKESASRMARGVMIDDFKTSRCFVKLRKYDKKSDSSIVEVIIHEGKNHQVKRMFEAVGYHVEKLHRERVGIFTVQDLKSGEYRKLSPKEVSIIYSLKK